jgi:hypothetical protein
MGVEVAEHLYKKRKREMTGVSGERAADGNRVTPAYRLRFSSPLTLFSRNSSNRPFTSSGLSI